MARATAFAPLLALALLLPGCASRRAPAPNPYSADQIERLLRGAVPPARILSDAARECISFRMTADVQTLLVSAGATASFVDALRTTCYQPAQVRT